MKKLPNISKGKVMDLLIFGVAGYLNIDSNVLKGILALAVLPGGLTTLTHMSLNIS